MFLIPFIATGIRDSGLGGESRSDFVSTVASWGKFCSLCALISPTAWETQTVPVCTARECAGRPGIPSWSWPKGLGGKTAPKTELPFQALSGYLNCLGLQRGREGIKEGRRKGRKEASTYYFCIFSHRAYFNFFKGEIKFWIWG